MPSRGQSLTVEFTVWDATNNAPKTGDNSNLTLYWNKDGTASTTTNASSEVSSSNQPGTYKITLTSSECTCDFGRLHGKSSSSGCYVIPLDIAFEQLPTAAPAANGGLPTVNASNAVLVQTGTGTGQLDFTSGRIKADVAYFGGAAGTFASGIPDVNTVKISGTAQTARDIGASVLLSPGTGTGQVSITSGVVSANAVQISGDATAADTLELFAEALDQSTGQLDSGSLADGTITAASLASDAGTEIATAVWASGTRTLTSLGTDAITADVLATSAVNEITAAIWAKTVDGITFESWAIAMLAVLTGVTDLVDADNIAFKNQSGSTKVTVTYGTNPGERDVVVIA